MVLKIKTMGKTTLQWGTMYGILAISSFAHADTKIENPLGDVNTFDKLVLNSLKILTPLAFTFAVVAVIIVGFKFVVAAVSGNEAEYKSAKKALVWVLIGAAVAVGAYAIAQAVVESAKQLTS